MYRVAGFQVKKDGALKIRLSDHCGAHEVTIAEFEAEYFTETSKAESVRAEMEKKEQEKLFAQKSKLQET